MSIVRTAAVTWQGSLADGSGRIESSSSGAIHDLPVTWASRTSEHEGRTSPEELLAAAHASCFSMALSGELTRAGHVPERLNVTAAVTFDKVEKWTVVASALSVTGRVPGIDAATFATLAETAKGGCPISRALAPSIKVSVEARLDG